MQVILRQDMPNLGHEGDVVTVADGYARNYLLPRKLAVEATKGALKDLEQQRRAIQRRRAEKQQAAQAMAERLAEQTLVIRATVGEGGRLHGQITPQQIAAAIKEQMGIEVDRRSVEIAEPIRQTGDYLVSVELYKGVRTRIALSVVSEAAQAEEEGAAAQEQAEEQPQAEEAPVEEEAVQETTGTAAGESTEQS